MGTAKIARDGAVIDDVPRPTAPPPFRTSRHGGGLHRQAPSTPRRRRSARRRARCRHSSRSARNSTQHPQASAITHECDESASLRNRRYRLPRCGNYWDFAYLGRGRAIFSIARRIAGGTGSPQYAASSRRRTSVIGMSHRPRVVRLLGSYHRAPRCTWTAWIRPRWHAFKTVCRGKHRALASAPVVRNTGLAGVTRYLSRQLDGQRRLGTLRGAARLALTAVPFALDHSLPGWRDVRAHKA